MDDDTLKFKEALAKQADERRNKLTHIDRVRSEFPVGHVLASMTNAMAIAMTYAVLEGFVKEALQLYVEFIEQKGISRAEALPCLVAYSWRPEFDRLKNNMAMNARITFVETRLDDMTRPLVFGEKEKTIDTKSNLGFKVLDELATTLGLDRSPLLEHKIKLDALKNKRNAIAHGSRLEQVSDGEAEDAMTCTQRLFDVMEHWLHEAVDNESYRRGASATMPRAPTTVP